MFSAQGSLDGVIFALSLRDTLYVKVDDGNRQAYEAEGSSPSPHEPGAGRCGSAPTADP